MKVLSVETSSVIAGAAIISDNKLVYEGYSHHNRNHSAVLMTMIEAAFEVSELRLENIDVIAVTKGPGSFTGLRIGIAAVKGLTIASEKPIAAIPTLDALAYNIPACSFDDLKGENRIVCPLLDARRKQVYASIYIWHKDRYERLRDYMALPVEELADMLMEYNLPVVFVGDGAPVHREVLTEIMQDKANFAPLHLMYQRPSVTAWLGIKWYNEGLCVDSAQLKPFYLRKSQAEQKLQKG